MPAWAPVVGVIVVVFGILGLLFFVRSATGAPRIAKDHWHAPYTIYVCDERQPNIREIEPEGVGTHGDGIFHVHPFTTAGEGTGAQMDKFFDRAGGKLTKSELKLPGRQDTWKNGDTCKDGTEGKLQVYVNDKKLGSWERYIPRDGDRIRIVFGKVEEEPVREADRTILPPSLATRQVEMEITGAESATRIEPASLSVNAEETVKLLIRNNGPISHGLRFAGIDGQYDTSDDFVTEPEVIPAGGEGSVVIRFDTTGEFEFRDSTFTTATGKVSVEKSATPTPDASPAAEAGVTIDVTLSDNAFTPAAITVAAGRAFTLKLTNEGPAFVHNLRISGPDGEFDTDDDLLAASDYQRVGQPGELTGLIEKPGVYQLRCDFHSTEMLGTITVE